MHQCMLAVPGLALYCREQALMYFPMGYWCQDLSLKRKALSIHAFTQVRSLGQAFIANGHSQSADIAASLEALNARWEMLFTRAGEKQAFLTAAHDMHRFRRDVDEVTARVAEMATAVGTDDVGKVIAWACPLLPGTPTYRQHHTHTRTHTLDHAPLITPPLVGEYLVCCKCQ